RPSQQRRLLPPHRIQAPLLSGTRGRGGSVARAAARYARRSACRSATCSREEAVGVRGAHVPAQSRVAPRVLPSLRRAFPPVDGIAAVCRAALEGAAVGSAIVLREKGHWVGDDGAGGLKPSVTRASVVGPAAFVSVYARSPRSSAHRRGTPRRPTSPSAASRQSGCRMATGSGTTRPATTHRSRMSSANTRTPSNHRTRYRLFPCLLTATEDSPSSGEGGMRHGAAGESDIRGVPRLRQRDAANPLARGRRRQARPNRHRGQPETLRGNAGAIGGPA